MAENARRSFPKEEMTQSWRLLDDLPATAKDRAQAFLNDLPGNADITLLLAAAQRRLGEVTAARQLLRPLMTERTRSPVAWFEWGMILCETDQETDAAGALRRATSLEPGFAGAWRALGDVLIVLGSGVAAGQAYAGAARAATRDPSLVDAAIMLTDGRAAKAEQALKTRLRQSPSDVPAIRLLGEAAMRAGHGGEAEMVLKHCLALAPEFADARHSLAILHYSQRKFSEAAAHFRILLDRLPHQPSLRALLARCYVETGDDAAAIALYEKMLSVFRDQAKIWLSYGHALKTLGREAEAATAYREALRLAPDWSAGIYLSLADIKTLPFTDAELEAMRGRLGRTSADNDQLHFALGSALEQRGDHEAAFSHFAQGAALRRASVTYDAGITTAYVEACKAVFTPAFFDVRRDAGNISPAPIFIVGLPRAGSTLVEQILASHPDVEGTSELKEIGLMASGLRGGRPAPDLPAIIEKLDPPILGRLGQAYLENTRQFRHLGRAHFTDKMPDNFLHIGLIHLILPQARIIDVRRSAMAWGFAAFKQYFQAQQEGQSYTYDLTEIGRYYQDYVALTAHFDAALPGRVFHIRYEDLVTDTETQIRALLDHCGLPFNPACLRFWETSRAIQTPSAQQVRRPIFRESLEHWRHFAPWLGHLRVALGPMADS